MRTQASQVLWFEDLDRTDVPRVGGKNASLGVFWMALATFWIEAVCQ